TRDGRFIAGVNAPVNGAGTVYLYESASHTVLRSRLVVGATPTVAISDDGARIQSGAILFDAASLRILATQNALNSPYPITPGTVFPTAVVQGGAAFGPDNTLYAAYNVPPVQAPTNLSQLMLNDPDNLLIRIGIQLPESLAGRLIVSSDGADAYALSDSG